MMDNLATLSDLVPEGKEKEILGMDVFSKEIATKLDDNGLLELTEDNIYPTYMETDIFLIFHTSSNCTSCELAGKLLKEVKHKCLENNFNISFGVLDGDKYPQTAISFDVSNF